MDKITFERLDIELTRRCNMACAHCMRGDAQNKAAIIDTKQKLAKTGNAGILGFLISEMANAVKAQNWKQIASGAQAKDYLQ